mmetsp:Transcript_27524/g.74172  ORF Transcript_27524/g.74172 Transcript_27524/m.74172 type:complete len:226 (+) Transcript_27524:2137-2814(+)
MFYSSPGLLRSLYSLSRLLLPLRTFHLHICFRLPVSGLILSGPSHVGLLFLSCRDLVLSRRRAWGKGHVPLVHMLASPHGLKSCIEVLSGRGDGPNRLKEIVMFPLGFSERGVSTTTPLHSVRRRSAQRLGGPRTQQAPGDCVRATAAATRSVLPARSTARDALRPTSAMGHRSPTSVTQADCARRSPRRRSASLRSGSLPAGEAFPAGRCTCGRGSWARLSPSK